MLKYNLKTSIRRYSIFRSWYNVFTVNVSDFCRYFTAKNQKPLLGLLKVAAQAWMVYRMKFSLFCSLMPLL